MGPPSRCTHNALQTETTMLTSAVSNPTKNQAIASLESQVAFLRRALAEVERELADLKGETRDEEDELVVSEPRSLPNELWLEVGSYLEPGSRSLLCLASTCKTLFKLLLPRLLERITSHLILLDPRFYTWREKKLYELARHVKEILFHGVIPLWAKEPVSIDAAPKLLRTCSTNLRELMVDLKGMSDGTCLWEQVFPNLQSLNLWNAPGDLHRTGTSLDWARAFPKLRRLSIGVDSFRTDFWRQMSASFLDQLETLDLRFYCRHGKLAKLPDLVSRLNNYLVTHVDSFRALLSTPAFQPKMLDFDSIATWSFVPREEAAGLWTSITKLTSLEELDITSFDSELFRTIGIPPNLRRIHISLLEPLSQPTAEALDELRAKFVTSAACEIFCSITADNSLAPRGSPHWDGFVEELLFWSSKVGSQQVLVSVDLFEKEAEDVHRQIDEIEDELDKRSPGFKGISWSIG